MPFTSDKIVSYGPTDVCSSYVFCCVSPSPPPSPPFFRSSSCMRVFPHHFNTATSLVQRGRPEMFGEDKNVDYVLLSGVYALPQPSSPSHWLVSTWHVKTPNTGVYRGGCGIQFTTVHPPPGYPSPTFINLGCL